MAKRFVFRLQVLLNARRRREQTQRRIVAERVRDVQLCREQLTQLEQRLRGSIDQSRAGRGSRTLDASLLIQEQRWRLSLKRRMRQAGRELVNADSLLSIARAELSARSKERKAIEKLKERRLKEYQAGVAKEERSEADETGARMMQRKTTLFEEDCATVY